MSLSRYVFSVRPQEVVLAIMTIFWGGTFFAVRYALTLSDPCFFVGLRFAVAALVISLVTGKCLYKITLLEIKVGIIIGFSIALGYILQTWGLQFIPSSKSAFITTMYVPLVPMLQWLCLGRIPGLFSCIGIILAFIGLILLADPRDSLLNMGQGELVTLASTVAIAAEIILISAWATKVDVKRVTVIQLTTASIISFVAMGSIGESIPHTVSPSFIIIVLCLGIFSAIVQVTMNWAQQSVSPTRATVIYTAEPVWAGIFGRIAGEHFSLLMLVGAAFIVIGVLVSELRLKKSNKYNSRKT